MAEEADDLERLLERALDALPSAFHALVVRVLDLPTEERHDAIATLYMDGQARGFADFLIAAEHDEDTRNLLRAGLRRLG